MYALNLKPSPNLNVTQIFCGTSTPKLSGSIDLSLFPNLINFTCTNNDIFSIKGYESNTKLRDVRIFNNIINSIPNLNNNTELRIFYCQTNQITGTIPILNSNTQLLEFTCQTNKFTGSIPTLNNLFNLQIFRCHTNLLTGSIPSLSANTQLLELACQNNQLIGFIPSINNNNLLRDFRCNNNQLTGFAGGSVSINLGNFQAQNNQLSAAAVNDILAAFVTANRTSGTRILNLGGTGNAAPTGQGLTDKQTLIDRGWTVTTN